jgi:hypothetical protein
MSAPASHLVACRAYRDAHARYTIAFAKGDVDAIEEAFSRMQEIMSAFADGARWAETSKLKGARGSR